MLAVLQVGDYPYCFATAPRVRRVYVGHANTSRVYVIRDTVSGIAETPGPERAEPLPGPTVVRNVLVWSAMTPSLRNVADIALQSGAKLLDATGRVVMDLSSGPNDIRHLAPGVYFARRPETEDGRPGTAVRKIVIQR